MAPWRPGRRSIPFNSSGSTGNRSYRDERLNFYMYYPPQPLGFHRGIYAGSDAGAQANGRVENSSLSGGYAGSLSVEIQRYRAGNIYARYQEYRGGIKFQTETPSGKMSELETGIAWQPDPQWEFTVAYAFSQRNNLFFDGSGTAHDTGRSAGTVRQSLAVPSHLVLELASRSLLSIVREGVEIFKLRFPRTVFLHHWSIMTHRTFKVSIALNLLCLALAWVPGWDRMSRPPLIPHHCETSCVSQ